MTKKTKIKKARQQVFTYLEAQVVLNIGRYANKRPAIQLETLDGDPYATATVNLPNDTPAKDCVFIKDYSENEGMLTWLVENKIVAPTGRILPSGFVVIPEARLLEPWLTKAKT